MFCSSCGTRLDRQSEKNDLIENKSGEYSAKVEHATKSVPIQVKETFLQATEKINAMVGEQGTIDVNLRAVFSAVLKKHAKEEGENLFISGTKITTPSENEISTTWPMPWLFSRVFIVLAFSYSLLYICTYLFENMNALPGLIMVGSFVAPFSLLIFFWEMNAPRNISIYETAQMFFVGGTASLVLTLFLYSIFPVYDLNYSGAIAVGVVEEIGKLAVVIYFIRKLNPKFILNGLLIGATIGAGFAAFESAGYAFNLGLIYGDQAMISTIFKRAWMSVGTHVVWTAIAGAALVYVLDGNRFNQSHLLNSKFIKLFSVPVILHSIWDMPLYFLHHFNFLYLLLIIIAWIFIFTLINAGLQQIVRLNTKQVEESDLQVGEDCA
ncbi:PrsW family intramembrane metalloprotease [Sporosarcina sp. E16_3]|nr:PrsW family intramembrane metalloprotease [Sporosarcina sp. E16_3]